MKKKQHRDYNQKLSDMPNYLRGFSNNRWGGHKSNLIRGFKGSTYGAAGKGKYIRLTPELVGIQPINASDKWRKGRGRTIPLSPVIFS